MGSSIFHSRKRLCDPDEWPCGRGANGVRYGWRFSRAVGGMEGGLGRSFS